MIYETVKVYLDGTMVVFEEADGTPIGSFPAGRITTLPQKSSGSDLGFVFRDQVTKVTIAAVKNFDDVLDSGGSPYGASWEDVRTALNAFLNFNSGGGAGLTAGNSSQEFRFLDFQTTGPGFLVVPGSDLLIQEGEAIAIEVRGVANSQSTNESYLSTVIRVGKLFGGALNASPSIAVHANRNTFATGPQFQINVAANDFNIIAQSVIVQTVNWNFLMTITRNNF